MTVWVNGEERELPPGATVAEAVQASGAPADGRGVAAAVDGEVVPRERWPGTALEDGQRVEVVHAVQGG
jgi:sulfur carrier protein